MEIKNVREPNSEEKKSIIPKLVLFGITTAVVTSIVYLINFYNIPLEESMRIADKLIPNKVTAQHDIIVKLFEIIYGRDYMLNKLEGLTVSAIISVISELVVGIIYGTKKGIKEL